MIPPTPHNRKNLVDPKAHESPGRMTVLGAAQSARVNGPVKGLWRAVSINELNMIPGGADGDQMDTIK